MIFIFAKFHQNRNKLNFLKFFDFFLHNAFFQIYPNSNVIAKTPESPVKLEKTQNPDDFEGILTETSDLRAQTTSKMKSDTNLEQFAVLKDKMDGSPTPDSFHECHERDERRFECFEAGDGADRMAKETMEDEQSPYSSVRSLYYSVV
uniref:Uncharacterized protein n=1 Tax=Bursaphelenchus xylophilus TaxID=6326 RepID=A0A1I7SIX8_BURXY